MVQKRNERFKQRVAWSCFVCQKDYYCGNIKHGSENDIGISSQAINIGIQDIGESIQEYLGINIGILKLGKKLIIRVRTKAVAVGMAKKGQGSDIKKVESKENHD